MLLRSEHNTNNGDYRLADQLAIVGASYDQDITLHSLANTAKDVRRTNAKIASKTSC